MISAYNHICRETSSDLFLSDIVRLSLLDNTERIPLTSKGGYISTELGENNEDESIKISVHGFLDESGRMKQTVTVICFESLEKAKSFFESPEGEGFDDTYSDGKGCFDFTTDAGNPRLPILITEILKKHFGFEENSHLTTETHCEVDYFL